MNKDISVLTSVYKNDIPKNVKIAIESIVNQTLKPKQIVMIIDGPVSDELMETINELAKKYKILEVYPLEKNVGLGTALKIGTGYCKYDYIARMDSDDIAVPERFEKQMACFESDPELSLVGSNAQEFFNEPENLANIKAVPETHEEIVEFMKERCPFCHMSVIMKKDMLEKAGGYEHWYYAEDYYLWIRMFLAGAKFYNIQENLMYVRINYDTFERRGGMKYYKSIKGLLKIMKQNELLGFMRYNKAKLKRYVGHVLVPKKLKSKLYMKFMREKNSENEEGKEKE